MPRRRPRSAQYSTVFAERRNTLGLGCLLLRQTLDGRQMLGFVVTQALKTGAQVEEILQLQARRNLHQPLGQAQRLRGLAGPGGGQFPGARHQPVGIHHLQHDPQRLGLGYIDDPAAQGQLERLLIAALIINLANTL